MKLYLYTHVAHIPPTNFVSLNHGCTSMPPLIEEMPNSKNVLLFKA